MANVEDLFDDFELKGLDESKWGNWQGQMSILSSGGLRLGVGAGANQYSIVSSSATYDARGARTSIQVDSMVRAGDSSNAAFYLTSSGGFVGWNCDGTNLVAEYKQGTSATQALIVIPWNPSEQKFWRVRHNRSNNIMVWETSRDGQSWSKRTQRTMGFSITSMRVEFQCGYWDAGDPGSGAFTIRYFNTQQSIDRGPGFLTETFDDLRTANLPYNVNWGPIKNLDDGGNASNIRIYNETTGGKSLRVAGTTDVRAVARTDLKQNFTNIDLSVDVILESNGNRPGGAYDYDTPRLAWRVQRGSDNLGYGTRYELSFFKDYAIVWRVTPTSSTPLKNISIGTDYGVRYRWRITHIGPNIVVYRSFGDYSNTGYTAPPVEIARVRDTATPLPGGQVGFIAFSSAARFDNLQIKPASLIPSKARTARIKSRKWGAFAARGEVQVVGGQVIRPVEMMEDTSALYDLEELVGRTFDIASWFAPDNGPFPLAQALEFAERGKQNLISWGPERIHWDRIIAGDLNPLLDEFIDCIAQLPTQTVLRLMPEMNGEWSPWSTHYNTGAEYDPARTLNFTTYSQYIQTWRYIVNYFRSKGSTVQFLFCINETDEPRTNTMERYYPGDLYVDLTGFDAYNWGTGGPFRWRPHTEVWEDAYNRLVGLSARNKVWVCEFASKEPTKNDGKAGFTPDPSRSPADPAHDKGEWVTEMMEDFYFSKIEALVAFNIDKERDWRMESSPSSLAAYRAGFASAKEPDVMTELDPITNPLPIPLEYDPVHSTGQVEYMRLEEEGYPSLVLEPTYGGIWLANFDLGYAEIRESVEDAPLRNGTYDLTSLTGAKSVTLNFQLIPYMNASVPYMVSLLSRWAEPRRRPVLVYKPFDGDERRIKLRANQLSRPVPINVRDHTEVSMSWVAYEGTEETTFARTSVLTPNAGSLEVLQMGSSEAYPVIRLYGPLTNPAIYNETLDTEGGARLTFNTTISSGQFFEINTKERSVQLNGWADPSANRRNTMVERRWFSLVPFVNMVRLDADSGSGRAELVYHDTWL